jgi:hypothetical protein
MSGRQPTEPTSTTEEIAVRPHSDDGRPVLVVVADAADGGGVAGGERVIAFERVVEIGRRPRAEPGVAACCPGPTGTWFAAGLGGAVWGRTRGVAAPESAEIEALLNRHKGNIAEVARELDRQWAVVWRWVQKSGVDIDKYRR